jgi:hypothetical protein
MARKTSKTRASSRAATLTERNAIAFKGEQIDFNWTNEEWALTHLPMVRAATVVLRMDRHEVTEAMRRTVASGSAPDMLEGMTVTKKHLAALVDALDAALMRQFLCLEALGYSPENLPPESPMPHLATKH